MVTVSAEMLTNCRYSPHMPKKATPKKEYSWRISRIRGTPAAFTGIVDAPDKEAAIKRAIEEFKITNPEHQKRLVAHRRD
jgi:hypothetical protein